MPYKNYEDKLAWQQRNKEKQKLYQAAWMAGEKGQAYLRKQQEASEKQRQIRERVRAERLQYELDHADEIKAKKMDKNQRYRKKKRLEAISKMGGHCINCGIDDADVLEFDHIVPVLRRTNGVTTRGDSWKQVLAHPKPDEIFQLLCANCHTKKTRLNKEHTLPDAKGTSSNSASRVVRQRGIWLASEF